MVIVQQKTEEKTKTPSQEALLARLIQSETFTKSERDDIVKRIAPQLKTSYDASVLISYMLAKMRLHRHFNGKRKHKIAECRVCQNRVGLVKIDNPLAEENYWLCQLCKIQYDSPDPESEFASIKEEDRIQEEMELKADEEQRQAEYNGRKE